MGANYKNEIASTVADRKELARVLFQGKCAVQNGSFFAGCLLSETFNVLFYYHSRCLMSNSVMFILSSFKEICCVCSVSSNNNDRIKSRNKRPFK